MKAQTKRVSERATVRLRAEQPAGVKLDIDPLNSGLAEMILRLHSLEGMLPAERQMLIQDLIQQVEYFRCELQETRNRVVLLENMANKDTLVPVFNRRGFLQELKRAISYAKRYKSCVSLIYLDIDKFKLINDRFGHSAGDKALTEIANILIEHTRASDVIGRIGGDEFAIILHHASNDDSLVKAAQLASQVAGRIMEIDGEEVSVTISAGVTELTFDDDPLNVLSRADRMMYANKQFASTSKQY